MKIKAKDIVLIAIVAVILVVIAMFGFPDTGNTDEKVKADITIDFIEAAPSLHPGNLTTWVNEDGEWTFTSVDNAGHTVWVFRDVPSDSNCLSQLQEALEIAGVDMDSESQPLGIFVTMIDDVRNEIPGAGWQYYVDGVYANRACNKIPVPDGGEVTWKFQMNQMGG